MQAVLLVIHVLVAVGLIVLILLQKSEGGALGMGGGPGGLMSGSAAGDVLTRGTSILAAVFFMTSISLAILAGLGRDERSELERQAADADVIQPITLPTEPVDPEVPRDE